MNSSVRRLIFATTAAAVIAIAAAFALFPLRPEIGGPVGVAFWTALTFIGSAMPVRLPRGTVVSVSAAPMIAALALGGPVAAAIVGLIGGTDLREIRGKVPWYGTLFNHGAEAFSLVVGAMVFTVIAPAVPQT